jgi:short-subunit dehydrogenase
MQNKTVVLITGCSSGFGLLTSKFLAMDTNFIIYASMRDLSKKSLLMAEVSKINRNIEFLEIDVTKKDTIEAGVKKIYEAHGKIDVLINNAGYAMGGFFEDLTEQEIREQMETNFFGMQNMTRAVLPIMHKNKTGKIINLSSIAGLVGFPGLGAYNASKHAVEGFSESLRLELLPFGIKVYLIEPGSFKTKIFEDNAKFACNHDNCESKYFDITKHFIETRIKKLDKVRGNPEDVAKKIIKVIKQKNPKFRNMVGVDAFGTLIFKRIMPYSIFERIVNFVAMKK